MPILNRCNNCQGVREAAAEKGNRDEFVVFAVFTVNA